MSRSTKKTDYIIISKDIPSVMISESLLDNSWSAASVQPKFFLNALSIRESNLDVAQLGNVAFVTDGPFGSDLKVSDYRDTGIPVFRVADVVDLELRTTNLVFISDEKHRKIKRSEVLPRDVLITKAGRIGSATVVPDFIERGNITSHLCLVRLNDNRDPYYLAAYLECRIGRIESLRQSFKATRPELSAAEVKKIEVPWPKPSVQKVIGSRVRDALQYLHQADELQDNAEKLFSREIDLLSLSRRLAELDSDIWNWVSIDDIQGRWDAEFFQKRNHALLKHLKAHNSIRLERLIKKPRKGKQPEYASDPSSEGLVPALTGSEVDPYFINREKAKCVTRSYHESSVASALKENDIVLTVTGPPLGEAALVRKHHLPCNLASEVVRIETKRGVFPGYLTLVFNSIIGVIQVYQWCRGIRQKHLYPDQIMGFFFPLLDEKTMEEIDRKIKDAEDKRGEARRLLRQAKQEIEDLIEGRIDGETILKRAQAGL